MEVWVQQRVHFRWFKLTGGCKLKILTTPPPYRLGIAHIGAT